MNYYNEFDQKIAAWLRQLIADGHIPAGEVDERSIEDVCPSDLAGFTQCHFFAGIGGWSHALDLARWPRDQRVWTGSCPCQPFSAAGQGNGFADERHLWPAWQHLIAQCSPPVVFGEQVASKAADVWIDLVQADLEGMGYAFGCVPFPSAGIGAPHIRDRNYWMGFAIGSGLEGLAGHGDNGNESGRLDAIARGSTPASGAVVRLADPNGANASAEREQRGGEQRQQPQDGGAGGVGLADGATGERDAGGISRTQATIDRARLVDGREPDGPEHAGAGVLRLANAPSIGRIGRRTGEASNESGSIERSERLCDVVERPGPLHGFWRDADWLLCTDGKWRPVEPGTFPLAHGIPARMVRLRGYGNAINPHQAAEFIRASVEVIAA